VAKMVNGNIVMEKIARPAKDVSLQYYRFIIEKLRALTSFGQPKGIQGTVEMLFTLDSQGQLKNAPKVMSFSNQELVSAAIDCIKNASPFSPFPEELKKPEESFHVTLEYK